MSHNSCNQTQHEETHLMNLKISQAIEKSQQFEIGNVSLLVELMPQALLKEVIEATNAGEQRKRKLRTLSMSRIMMTCQSTKSCNLSTVEMCLF